MKVCRTQSCGGAWPVRWVSLSPSCSRVMNHFLRTTSPVSTSRRCVVMPSFGFRCQMIFDRMQKADLPLRLVDTNLPTPSWSVKDTDVCRITRRQRKVPAELWRRYTRWCSCRRRFISAFSTRRIHIFQHTPTPRVRCTATSQLPTRWHAALQMATLCVSLTIAVQSKWSRESPHDRALVKGWSSFHSVGHGHARVIATR